MPRRTKEEAAQTRQAVLDAALDIFYEKGFSRTTFDEIARRIDLTKGAVYWHFRNKADLLVELMRQKFYLKDDENKHFDRYPETIDELLEQVNLHCRSIENDPAFQKFLFFIIFQMEWSETISQKVWQQIRDIRDFPLKYLKETLTFVQKSGEMTPNVDVDDLALILLCQWRGSLNAYISHIFPCNLSTSTVQSFELILDGLRVEKK